jgi:predicted nucleic acid-binding Zn ribbon protein
MSDERRGGPDPVPLTSSLDRVVRSLRPGAGRAEVGGVFGRWEDAVGPAVALHVRPIRLDRGVLLVEVDDPAWATHVRFLADDLRSRLRSIAGVEVRELEVRVAGRGGRTSGRDATWG